MKLEVDLLDDCQGSAAGTDAALSPGHVLCLIISAEEQARARIRRLLAESGGARVTTVEAEDVLAARSVLRSVCRPSDRARPSNRSSQPKHGASSGACDRSV